MTQAGLDDFPSHCKHYHPRLLPAIHQGSLSDKDKESVIVSSVIAVHTLRRKGEIKTVSVLL